MRVNWICERVAGPFEFTKGPSWDGTALLFTGIPSSRILRYDPDSGETTEHLTGTNGANGTVLGNDGLLYACERDSRRIVRYEADGSPTVIVDNFEGKRFNNPNDITVDSAGRLWFTDPRYGDVVNVFELDHQSVFRLDPKSDGGWKIERITFDMTRPNGLLVSLDMQWLYVAQSEFGDGRARELRAYPILENGSVGEYEVLHNLYPHRGIDGMCLDTDGNLITASGWEISGPGNIIYVFAPSGRVLETHPIPARASNCTFGDADLKTFYVTAGGALYRARTHRQGLRLHS